MGRAMTMTRARGEHGRQDCRCSMSVCAPQRFARIPGAVVVGRGPVPPAAGPFAAAAEASSRRSEQVGQRVSDAHMVSATRVTAGGKRRMPLQEGGGGKSREAEGRTGELAIAARDPAAKKQPPAPAGVDRVIPLASSYVVPGLRPNVYGGWVDTDAQGVMGSTADLTRGRLLGAM